MKCIRCGNEVAENSEVCDNCGFSMKEQKEYIVLSEQDDSLVTKETNIRMFDNPILTFIFGLITILGGIVDMAFPNIIIFVLIINSVFFALTFFFSTRITKIKLKPLRNVGLVMGYIGIAISIFKIFLILATQIIK